MFPALEVGPAAGIIYGIGGLAVVLSYRVPDAFVLILGSSMVPVAHMISDDEEAARAGLCTAALFYFVRIVQLVTSREHFLTESLTIRYAHCFLTFVDIRLRKPVCARWDILLLKEYIQSMSISVFYIFCFTAWIVLAERYSSWQSMNLAVTCTACGFIFMLILNVYGRTMQLGSLLLGSFTIPQVMDRPHTAVDIQEIWASRWNKVIQKLLKEGVYIPLRKRQVSTSVASAMTFLASGIIHTYIVLSGSRDVSSCCMLGYFLAQAILTSLHPMIFTFVASRKLRWFCTWAFMLLPAPLFIIPGLNLFRKGDSKIGPGSFLNLEFFMAQFLCVAMFLVVTGSSWYPQDRKAEAARVSSQSDSQAKSGSTATEQQHKDAKAKRPSPKKGTQNRGSSPAVQTRPLGDRKD